MAKKRFVVVGTGGRSDMYISALAGGDYKDYAELVGLCDINQGRMDYYNKKIAEKYNHQAYKQRQSYFRAGECRKLTLHEHLNCAHRQAQRRLAFAPFCQVYQVMPR